MVKNKSDNPSKIFLFIATKGVINTCLIINSDESKTINNKKIIFNSYLLLSQ